MQRVVSKPPTREMTPLRPLLLAATLLATLATATAQEAAAPDAAFVGELMAFHGSRAIVDVMTTHCYETTGLDSAYQTTYDNWYLRNIGFLDLADRVARQLGGGTEEEITAAETYGGTQIMSAYNQAESKTSFCTAFRERVDNGELDIDKQLPDALRRAQQIAAQ